MLTMVIFLSTLQLVLCSCPSGFELARNGECRGNVARQIFLVYNQAADSVVSKCQAIGAQPIIIHTEEDELYWEKKEHYLVPMGLTCNTTSARWEWLDGSPLDYKPPTGTYDKELDETCTPGCVWFVQNPHCLCAYPGCRTYNKWSHKCGQGRDNMDVWCWKPVSNPDEKECDNFEHDTGSDACYQVDFTAENWQDARNVCRDYLADLVSIHNAQENTFMRRLAVSKGALNGVFLGATLSEKNVSYGWIDGSEWDYDNFSPGFPNEEFGDCVSMNTLDTSGQWINTDCNSEQAFACRREPYVSYSNECLSGPWKEGQIITSPGYPYNATIPCEYWLTVEAGKKVEVTVAFFSFDKLFVNNSEIHSLEVNTCCDYLILTDNYIAGNTVANLTGEMSAQTYKTESSNFMRVSWQPYNGVNVRGFMMSFRGV